MYAGSILLASIEMTYMAVRGKSNRMDAQFHVTIQSPYK